MYYTTKYGSFFTSFSYVFLIFNYWNVDIAMFVLRSPISPQMSKRIFGIIKERGGVGVQISIRVGKGLEKQKLTDGGTFIWHPRVLFHYLKTWFLTWNQINRSRFTSPGNLTSNPYLTAVNHCCKGLHITCEFLLDLPMIKNSGNNLTHSWRLNFFTYITARVLNSCFNSPLRYQIYVGV